MLGSIFASLGGFIGKFFGGGIFSSTGRFIGKWLGDSLEREDEEVIQHYKIAKVKDNLFPISNSNGIPIPLIFGKGRVLGAMIWSTSISEIPITTSISHSYRTRTNIYNNVDFLYYCSFAIAIAEGYVSSIERVWCNEEILELSSFKHRIYFGSEEQMPDDLIIKHSSNGYAPAFRGIAYIVFEDFPLAEFGNNIPKFHFEITRKPNRTSATTALENKIKALNIIPGSGEFVYDTVIQTKKSLLSGLEYRSVNINSNNRLSIADALYSANYMKDICPNLEWVAPVVCWFTDSLDIANASIYPAVEFGENPNTLFSEEWKVANFHRRNAREISKNSIGSPNYGGTVNDASVIRYLSELKQRGYKIMFYPMIFVDLPGKPWRGYISGRPEFVSSFFNKASGYNEFILHYASLCRGLVDSFIIGSELKQITKIKNEDSFLAVKELKNLAKKVKDILGPTVKISYAADWSEYHHTEGGWYHLDELWASDSIDFVGIDNYMPLTESKFSSPNNHEIRKGFNSGEGYDYYIDNEIKKPLPDPYAWKNIKWWWSNEHINPDGKKTQWVPKSKKIWFTEYGFPSIDKAPNQPNVFYNPECVDGGAPKYSNECTDFSIQRNSIYEFLEFWSNEEYIENMFLWCFDARPYPNWPHSKKWGDWNLWEKGHWINGKIGEILLSEIVKEVSTRCNINQNIHFVGLDHNVHHISIQKNLKGFELINLLRTSYFFDIKDVSCNNITFVKRGEGDTKNLSQLDLYEQNNSSYKLEEIGDYFKKYSIHLRYNNYLEDYSIGFDLTSNDNSLVEMTKIYFPYNMSSSEARNLSSLILSQITSSKSNLVIELPLNYIFLKPSDMILINIESKQFFARVTNVVFENDRIKLTSIIEEKISLSLPSFTYNIDKFEEDDGFIEFVEIININQITNEKAYYFINNSKYTKPLRISSDDKYFETYKNICGGAFVGTVFAVGLVDEISYSLIM